MAPATAKAVVVVPAAAFFLAFTALAALYLSASPDLRSRLAPLTLASPTTSTPCGTGTGTGSPSPSTQPLRVYMYDLPRRFNVGMLERHPPPYPDKLPVDADTLPPWPRTSGMKRQHSVEYWMMASLLAPPEAAGEAVRVMDATQADAFFVPFFSSLSFNSHGHNMTDPETQLDRQLQVEVLDMLRQSEYWKRSGGRDHVIPITHPNAFRFFRESLNASILIVSDFDRFPRNISYLDKDVVAPYVHVVDSFFDDHPPDPFESRPILLFFRGRTVRKAEGIVRARLAKILNGIDDVRYEDSFATLDGIKTSTEGMRSSKFCLHPAGDTPSSCRLFDAIVSHCVPVIVSDRIELPYEDKIDYSEFSIFFSVKEAMQPNYIVEQLRRVSKERWTMMWKRLKNISHHYEYQYPPKRDDAVDMLWRQVRHKLPAVNLAVHRSGRLKIPDWWKRWRR